MTARKPDQKERRLIAAAATDIFERIRELPAPPHAAIALAIANATLIIEARDPEINTEEEARAMMKEMTEAVIDNWKSMTGKAPTQ